MDTQQKFQCSAERAFLNNVKKGLTTKAAKAAFQCSAERAFLNNRGTVHALGDLYARFNAPQSEPSLTTPRCSAMSSKVTKVSMLRRASLP